MEFWKTLQIIVIGLIGGIVRYLADFLTKAETLDKLSIGLLIIHGVVGSFAGYLVYLIVSLFITAASAGIAAAALGSFGSSGMLYWMLDQAKKRLVLMDETMYKRFVELRTKGMFN